jgi:hypothetical protein
MDRCFKHVFRNFSTLFLTVFVVTLPVYMVYAFIFRNVLAVRELHDVIATFPGKKQVGGVGAAQLDRYDLVGWLIIGGLVLALLFFVRCVRRTMERDADGHAPTVIDSLTHAPTKKPSLATAIRELPREMLMGVLDALIVGFLLEQIGFGLSEFLPDQQTWIGIGLTYAITKAAMAPFILVPWALATAGGYSPAKRSVSSSSVSTDDATSV